MMVIFQGIVIMSSMMLFSRFEKKSGSNSSNTSSTVSNICCILYTSCGGLIPIAMLAAVPAWRILNHCKNQQRKKIKDGLSGGTVDEVICEICLENRTVDEVVCKICLEKKEIWQMFVNDQCSHTFCSDCITKYIILKIQDRVDPVTCPALNCKARLNRDACKPLIPEDARLQWDELMCLSLIPESKRVYCPFLDCLAMLVNDSGRALRQTECVACKRYFCAQCHVDWHTEFTCEEFQKFAKKEGGDDEIVKELAKKNNWQRCPKCMIYVAKVLGCSHITCRCEYQFCYECGSGWSNVHVC